MKKTIIILIISVLFLFTGCSNETRSGEEIKSEIKSLFIDSLPTYEEISLLEQQYQKLSNSEKEKVTNYKTLQNYLSFDLDSMNEIIEYISLNLSDGNIPPYIEVKNIYEKYSRLSSGERLKIDYLTDGGEHKLLNAMSPNNYELAAIKVINYQISHLLNKSSFELYSVDVKLSKTNYRFYVLTDFSADNGFGSRINTTKCYCTGVSGSPVEVFTSNFDNIIDTSKSTLDIDKIIDNLDELPETIYKSNTGAN